MGNNIDLFLKKKNWKAFYFDRFIIVTDINTGYSIKLNISLFSKLVSSAQHEQPSLHSCVKSLKSNG